LSFPKKGGFKNPWENHKDKEAQKWEKFKPVKPPAKGRTSLKVKF